MLYKDLIYKITNKTEKNQNQINDKNIKPNINKAKQSLQTDDIIIGIIINEQVDITEDLLKLLKIQIERTLTVIRNEPISNNFIFLPFNLKTLKVMVESFPEQKIYFVADKKDFKDANDLKNEKLNLKMIFPSIKKKEDFISKIKYLITFNHELEPTMKVSLKMHNVEIISFDFPNLNNSNPQKEKLVVPDPNGWKYNPSNGLWTKTWGWDGSQTLQGW